ncbi:hypothetical protein SDC9_10440 [bioreactor metagenome]|uniref:Uncharacterized protein n=1 Tax=bioreactor metagenome TaxID=1076179 RepID=A0A644TDD8_9ZZZZ
MIMQADYPAAFRASPAFFFPVQKYFHPVLFQEEPIFNQAEAVTQAIPFINMGNQAAGEGLAFAATLQPVFCGTYFDKAVTATGGLGRAVA